MITYDFLQHYWWLLVSLLGALLVFMMFVQGANGAMCQITKDPAERQMIINSTARKWEIGFTTLVTFGGAFFASFPLFYSTSFGGAYWLWMTILLSYVVLAVSYEFQSRLGSCSRAFMVINGIVGPLLVGGAVATFFQGSNFVIDKGGITLMQAASVSRWANASHGLDALLDPWVLVLGLAVMFLVRSLGVLYIMNNVPQLERQCARQLPRSAAPFVLLFVAFLVNILTKDGYAVQGGEIVMEPYKYLHNLLTMWPVAAMLLLGVVLYLTGVALTIIRQRNMRGIWYSGVGSVLAVLALLLCAGWNDTAYYPSTADLQSSLTIANSCSSEFTLTVMSVVSLLIPFVLAYIVCAWRAMERPARPRA